MTPSQSIPLIAVGIGNTSLKVGRFAPGDSSGLPEPESALQMLTRDAPLDNLADWLPPERVSWRVASVQREAERRLTDWVARVRPGDDYQTLTRCNLPLEVRVESPERVGVDRLAAAVGANALREAGRPAVVVDTGSAITVNLIGPDGAFLGGAILPGILMSARALADNADLLPWVHAEPGAAPPAALGTSTETAIKGGLYWGAVGAIREIGARLNAGQPRPPQWFLTGGDAAYLSSQLGPDVCYVPHLVLGGIALAAK